MISLSLEYDLAAPTARMRSAVPSANFKFEISNVKLIVPRVCKVFKRKPVLAIAKD